MLPAQKKLLFRLAHGLGAFVYGGAGIGGMALWPMSIMMFDDPNWTLSKQPLLPLIWLGTLGVGPVFLFSSVQLGSAARWGCYAERFDVALPLAYTAGYTALWATAAAITEYRDNRKQEK